MTQSVAESRERFQIVLFGGGCLMMRPVEVKSVRECIFIPFKTRAIWRERVFKVKRNAANHSSTTQYMTQFSISELNLESFLEYVQKVFTEHKS